MENSLVKGFIVCLRSAVLALLLSLVFTWIYAVVLRIFPLSSRGIYPVTQVLKNVALAVGVLRYAKGAKGWLKGLCAALIYFLFSYLIYSVLCGTFALSSRVFIEAAITTLTGAIFGVIAVNLRR